VVRDPKRGDVFVVPTGDGRAGVGQVVATYGKDMLLSSSWGLERRTVRTHRERRECCRST
jgi:hypothetical protein